MAFVKFIVDGKECMSEEGKQLVEAAKENNIYIPTLCNYPGIPPKGSCRICTVLISGRPATACTTKVTEGMDIQSAVPELESFRKSVVEILFAEGNHFCPSCEKSGNCELQALGYKYTMMVRSEEHTSELQTHRDLHSFPTRRSSDLGCCNTVCRREPFLPFVCKVRELRAAGFRLQIHHDG